MAPLPTRTLLYRYLFYGWLFRDVNRGSLFERAQAWRHNCEQAHWLATYLRRWATGGVLWFLGGAWLEAGTARLWPAAALYVGGVVAVAYCAVTLVAWWVLVHEVRLH